MSAAAAAAADAAFDAVSERFVGTPRVTEGTGFGAGHGLRVDGHIFAMLVGGELVVKLPAVRCAALGAEGAARPLQMGARRMREWAVIAGPPDAGAWVALAGEALAFVRG